MADNEQLELQYELAESTAEISRHHADFAKVAVYSARANVLVKRLDPNKSTEQWVIDELEELIRKIRNVVG